MAIDTSRIRSAMDISLMRNSSVTVVGSAPRLVCDLARCGIAEFNNFDPDQVSSANIARQDHDADQIGTAKVKAVAKMVRQINPDVRVRYFVQDFLSPSDVEIDNLIQPCSLLIGATDNFVCQAKINEIAVRNGIPALFLGIHPRGVGEIVFWYPRLDCCFRCLLAKRFEAQEAAIRSGRRLDPSSDGCTIFDMHLLDALGGKIAIGLLNREADNVHGRLIRHLGDRQLLLMKLSHEYAFGGKDIFADYLRLRSEEEAYPGFGVTIALRDPDGGTLPCPVCEQIRGHRFVAMSDGTRRRLRPGDNVGDMTPVERPLARTTI